MLFIRLPGDPVAWLSGTSVIHANFSNTKKCCNWAAFVDAVRHQEAVFPTCRQNDFKQEKLSIATAE